MKFSALFLKTLLLLVALSQDSTDSHATSLHMGTELCSGSTKEHLKISSKIIPPQQFVPADEGEYPNLLNFSLIT